MTPKQALFVEEYLKDLNASAAAARAGYSAKMAGRIGWQLLEKPRIQSAIQSAQRERSARTGVTADRVIKEIARIAFSALRSVMSWGNGGVTLRESSELTDDEAAAVSEVIETTTKDGGSVKVKMHSKTDALDKLCRHLGLFKEQSVDDKDRVLPVKIVLVDGRSNAGTSAEA